MKLPLKSQFYFAASLFFVTNLIYAVWSFALTDPNLVFTSWHPFWAFQQFMWQVPKENITVIFVVLCSVMFGCSIWLSSLAEKLYFGFKKWLMIFLVVSAPLIFSNNALSHDVFNYIFNARMVVKYQMNPHVQVAQHFFYDPWIRFMHNIHTPAPYFYGWTALSIMPYVLGLEKFVLTWILFRLWSEFGLVLAFVAVIRLMKKRGLIDLKLFVLMLFSPLLMIEIVSNSHNDAWMMWPAIASLFLVTRKSKDEKLRLVTIVGSFALLAVSMSTKYATALLLPVWVYLVFQKQFRPIVAHLKRHALEKVSLNIFDVAAGLMFLPLLTDRAQQFHPWYLSWCLFFLPVMKNKFLRMCLLVLSVSSLLRYVPWMWNGAFEYTPKILMNEKLVTWVPLIVFVVIWLLREITKKKRA